MAKFYFYKGVTCWFSGYPSPNEAFNLLGLSFDDLVTIQECSDVITKKNIDEKIKEINILSQKEEIILFMPENIIASIKTKNRFLCDSEHKLTVYTYNTAYNQFGRVALHNMHMVEFAGMCNAVLNAGCFIAPCFNDEYNLKKMLTDDIIKLKEYLLNSAEKYNLNRQNQKIDVIDNQPKLLKDLFIAGIISIIPVLVYYLINNESFEWKIAAILFAVTIIIELMVIGYRHYQCKTKPKKTQIQVEIGVSPLILDDNMGVAIPPPVQQVNKQTKYLSISLYNHNNVVPENYMCTLKIYQDTLTILDLKYDENNEKKQYDEHMIYYVLNLHYMSTHSQALESLRVGYIEELAIFISMIYKYKFICLINGGKILTTSKPNDEDIIFDMLIDSTYPSCMGFKLTKYEMKPIDVDKLTWNKLIPSGFGYCIWSNIANVGEAIYAINFVDMNSYSSWDNFFPSIMRLNLLKRRIENTNEMRTIKSAQLSCKAIKSKLHEAKFIYAKNLAKEIIDYMDWPSNNLK